MTAAIQNQRRPGAAAPEPRVWTRGMDQAEQRDQGRAGPVADAPGLVGDRELVAQHGREYERDEDEPGEKTGHAGQHPASARRHDASVHQPCLYREHRIQHGVRDQQHQHHVAAELVEAHQRVHAHGIGQAAQAPRQQELDQQGGEADHRHRRAELLQPGTVPRARRQQQRCRGQDQVAGDQQECRDAGR